MGNECCLEFSIEEVVLNFSLCEGYSVSENTSYVPLSEKPKINNKVLNGDLTSDDLSLQNKLIPGDNIELIDNGDNTTTINSLGGSGGSLTSDLVVSNPLGKYAMNDVIDEGTQLETIFRGILSKTYYPSLTNPSVSINYSANTLMKVGALINSLVATLNFNRGSINPQYTSESPYRSGEATSYEVSLSGASVTYSDTKNTNQFTIPSFTRNSKGNVVLNAKVNYEAGVQPKDSDGANYQSPLPSGNVTSSKTIEFILPFYWGVSNSSNISSLNGFTEDLSKKGQKTYIYNANNQYVIIAYDSSYGNLTAIKDSSGFENIEGFNKSTLTYEGQTYNVYVSQFAITNPSVKFVYMF